MENSEIVVDLFVLSWKVSTILSKNPHDVPQHFSFKPVDLFSLNFSQSPGYTGIGQYRSDDCFMELFLVPWLSNLLQSKLHKAKNALLELIMKFWISFSLSIWSFTMEPRYLKLETHWNAYCLTTYCFSGFYYYFIS